LSRSTTARRAPCTTPSPIGHRLSYAGAEFGRKIRAVRPSSPAAQADPLRCAQAEIAVFAGVPRSTGPRRSASFNGRVVVAARPRSPVGVCWASVIQLCLQRGSRVSAQVA
jgi:hypothetical protein